jgi:Helix-turn-helix domain
VNSPTISFTTPAAALRTGRGSCALPPASLGTKIQFLPFAALPHDLRKDPRLKGNRTAIVLAAALLEYAPGVKPSCYPTNARLADDLGCCEQTVRTALAALQSAGWIRIALGANQPNGRRIWLLWRIDGTTNPPRVPDPPHLSDTPQPVGPLPQPAGGPLKPTGPEEEIVIEEGIKEESRQFAHGDKRPRGEPKPTSTAAPTPPLAPERVAEPALAPPPLAPLAPVQTLPPLAEVGPREARPAISRDPAGPNAPVEPPPRSSPPPVPGPTKAGPAPALTSEQQQRLAAMPEAARDQALLWLLSGDMILMREALRRLTPPRPRPEIPQTLPELLGRIRESPDYPAAAAQALCQALGDAKSYAGFKARCDAAYLGELCPTQLVSAFEQAMGPKVRNPGAVFQYVALHQRE